MIGNLFSSHLVLCMSSLGASCKIKFLNRPKGRRREGGPQIDSLKKGARRRPQRVCLCVCKSVCVCSWALCAYVCCESFPPAGGALMATGRHFTATQPPTIWLPQGRCYLCVLVPMLPFVHTHTQIDTAYSSTSLHWHVPASYLAQPLHYPHSAPRPPLGKRTPAVKVAALPASPLSALKLHSSLDTNTLHCLLIICLHHRMLFYSTERFSGCGCITSLASREPCNTLIDLLSNCR